MARGVLRAAQNKQGKAKLMKTRIHVNQHNIKSNRKHGGGKPVITVKNYKSNTYCHQAVIDGPSKVIYSPHKPLSCGAHVWVETDANVLTLNAEGQEILTIKKAKK